MHFRARSYDPRTGRFIEPDPNHESRMEEHFALALGNPTSNTDPTGERTYVTYNATDKIMKVTTRLVVTASTLFADERDTATRIGGDLAQAIHKYWNNNGAGWDITFNDESGKTQSAQLRFEPEIWGANLATFNWWKADDFDHFHYEAFNTIGRHAAITAEAVGKTAADYDPRFKVADPARVINDPPNKQHAVTVIPAATEWDYAHEIGHVMGLVDRYSRNGKDIIPDELYGTRFMGAPNTKLVEADLKELFKAHFKIDLISATKGKPRKLESILEVGTWNPRFLGPKEFNDPGAKNSLPTFVPQSGYKILY